MSALMWKAAVPAGQYPEHSCPRIVRHGKAAPSSPSYARPFLGQVEGRVAPPERIGGRLGDVYFSTGRTKRSVSQNVWPSYPGPVRPFAGDGALLGAGTGLKDVEEREAGLPAAAPVSPSSSTSARVPEVVEVLALRRHEPLPAGEARLGQRGDDLVADGRHDR